MKTLKYIQSLKNEKVKQWKKLLTKKGREQTGEFIVEGEHLVEEAVKSGVIKEILVSESYQKQNEDKSFLKNDYILVTDSISKHLSTTETPQGIYAVCKQMSYSEIKGKRYLLIDRVQDPGNLGTLIRTADAVGVDAVIVGEGSVDIYNPKVLRASQGSHFHLPIINGDLHEWISKLMKQNIPVYGTSLQNGVSMYTIKQNPSFALLVGNEGKGVHPKFLQMTTANLFIPIYGKSESLNVSVATGILLYYLRGNQ